MTEIKNNTSSSDISSMSSSCLTRGSRNKDIHSTGFPVKRGMTKDLESGRSMTEMLGVLAIVGVLSVGGIAGYTYAMNRHYANELLNGASQRAVILKAQKAAGLDLSLREFDGVKVAGGEFSPDVLEPDGSVGIAVSKVKGAVCKNLIQATEGTDIGIAQKADDNTLSDITEEECDDENDNDLVFVFETGLGGAGGGAKDVCENGNPYLSYMDDPCGTELSPTICSSDENCEEGCCHPEWKICVETCEEENKCVSNSECGTDEFCNLKSLGSDTSPSYGICEDIGGSSELTYLPAEVKYLISDMALTWWGADNWCKAQKLSLVQTSQMLDLVESCEDGDCDVEEYVDVFLSFWFGDSPEEGKAYRFNQDFSLRPRWQENCALCSQ